MVLGVSNDFWNFNTENRRCKSDLVELNMTLMRMEFCVRTLLTQNVNIMILTFAMMERKHTETIKYKPDENDATVDEPKISSEEKVIFDKPLIIDEDVDKDQSPLPDLTGEILFGDQDNFDAGDNKNCENESVSSGEVKIECELLLSDSESDAERKLRQGIKTSELLKKASSGNIPLFSELGVDSTASVSREIGKEREKYSSSPTSTRKSPSLGILKYGITRKSATFKIGSSSRELTEEQPKNPFQEYKKRKAKLSEFSKTTTQTIARENITESDFRFPFINDDKPIVSGSTKKFARYSFDSHLKDIGVGKHISKYNYSLSDDDSSSKETSEILSERLKESVKKKSFLPLLKQELQYKIQIDRLQRGEPELVLEPEAPRKYELTADERKKKEIRLQQNRESALRARMRALEHESRLQKQISDAMTETTRLSKECRILKNKRSRLFTALLKHLKVCPNRSLANEHLKQIEKLPVRK